MRPKAWSSGFAVCMSAAAALVWLPAAAARSLLQQQQQQQQQHGSDAAGTPASRAAPLHAPDDTPDSVIDASWFVIWVCSPVALLSLVLLLLGTLHLCGCLSCSRMPSWVSPTGHALSGLFWTLALPLTAYLLSQQILLMILYVVVSCTLAAAHLVMLIIYAKRAAKARALEQPQQQLLIPARDMHEARRTADDEMLNPTIDRPMLGVIPGTSNVGYILWLPGTGPSGGGAPDRAGPGAPPPHVQIPPEGYHPHHVHAYGGYQPAPSPTDTAGARGKERLIVPRPGPQS